MTRSLIHRTATMALASGLAVVSPSPTRAQLSGPTSTTGPNAPMTTGSGSQTAAGSITGSGGTSTTGSGMTITGSPLGTRVGSQGFGTGQPGSPTVPPSSAMGRQPIGSRLPDDPALVPLEALQGPQTPELGPMSEVTTVSPALLRQAQKITDPSERALALQRLAAAAIFSNELSEAHHALTQAANSALELQPSVTRDLRLIAIITTLINLAEADLREGKTDLSAVELVEPVEALPKIDREKLIRRARHEWERAAYLAERIGNPTYRAEQLFRVIENEAAGSETIANEFPRDGGTKPGVTEAAQSYDAVAGAILEQGAREAFRIERPVWRDRALVAVAAAGAASKQFSYALAVARQIPQPEVRTDALVRIAEAQARGDRPDAATPIYEEAARSIASIPLDDPRAVLTGVLIDNLISMGRFDDARASVALYPDTARRMIALGAIAESQGRRGAGDAARAWIARDVPAPYQSLLYRRVTDGIINAVEQNRSKALSGRGER